MSSILTHAIISNSLAAVDKYVNTANGLYQELEGLLNGLLGKDFVGDAADGYREFFNTNVKPALTDNLTTPASSLSAGIKSMLESIQTNLLDTVDPQLGDNNRNPGA